MPPKLTRTIVSALIVSHDKKVLLGKKDPKKGGVYLDKWHIPGGGVENDEAHVETLKREVQEETGLDIKGAKITFIDNLGTMVTPKKLPDCSVAECEMTFHIYQVTFSQKAADIKVSPGDDFGELQWVPIKDLDHYPHTPPSISLFLRLGWFNPTQALAQRRFSDADQKEVAYHGEELSWRVSAYAIVIKNDQLLIIKNKLEELHDVIGGGIEFGESLEDALFREAAEEGGASIKVGPLLHASLDWFYHRKGTYYQTLQLFYKAELVGDLKSPTDPDIEWVGWVPLSEIGTKYHLPPVVEKVISSITHT